MNQPLLQVSGLTVALSDQPRQKLIDGVSFTVSHQSIVAIVGGSGCGKTTTGLSILGLLPSGLVLRAGQIWYNGVDLAGLSQAKMRSLRAKEIAMVFQDPLQAFNPVLTIGEQVSEVLRVHTQIAKNKIREKVCEVFVQAGLEDPVRIFRSYPHQLSGGMRQRAMIAQAIAVSPALLIADEPTSSLDVTLQAKVLELFMQLKKEFKLSMILITHDWGVVKHLADYVVVMSHGKVVESGAANEIIADPKHEYTRQLIGALNV